LIIITDILIRYVIPGIFIYSFFVFIIAEILDYLKIPGIDVWDLNFLGFIFLPFITVLELLFYIFKPVLSFIYKNIKLIILKIY